MINKKLQGLIEQPPEKVLAVYRAVNELMQEGRDENTLRVSEITGRAGIGKGTAYEYFQSKEELVCCAICYNMFQEISKLWQAVLGEKNFKGKIYVILENIEENFAKRREWCKYLDFYVQSLMNKRELLTQILHCPQVHEKLELFTDNLVSQAIKEGLMDKKPETYYVLHAVITQVMGYVLFMESQDLQPDISQDDMKQFVYQNVIKIMQV